MTRTPQPGYGAQITVPIHPPMPPAKKAAWEPYITIPLELWSRGSINVLSARGLFVYLCLRLVLAGKADGEGAHVSSWDREKFCIKDDTWQRGFKELELLGMARGQEEDDVAVDRWSKDRGRRKVYYLNKTFLMGTDAPETRDGSPPPDVGANPQ